MESSSSPAAKSTLAQLLAISSKITYQARDGSTVCRDLAEEEGNRIFQRILYSAASDTKLQDGAEQRIKDLERSFFERVYDAARSAAGTVPVLELEWGRSAAQRSGDTLVRSWERDEEGAHRLVVGYRHVARECYLLGYVRAVGLIAPFLEDAKYWYTRLAQYLVSDEHLEMIRQRISAGDTGLGTDVSNWVDKLTILQNEGGEVDNALSIDKVLKKVYEANGLNTDYMAVSIS